MIQVVLGEHDISQREGSEQRFNVVRVLQHYQYQHWTFDNDIMLLKVTSWRSWDVGLELKPISDRYKYIYLYINIYIYIIYILYV